MKPNLPYKFPWQQLKKGQGFFIPCLDTKYVTQEGLKAAVRCRVLTGRARTVIFNGQFGVFFQRGPL